MKRKPILNLTARQKAQILGDPVRLAVLIGPWVDTITWRSVKAEMPDDTLTVLVACAGVSDAEQAFYSEGRWFFGDGHQAHRVYAWAHMPATPRAARGRKGGAL